MPGLTGIIGRNAFEGNGPALERMVQKMVRERFYTSGTYSNGHVGLRAGWVCHSKSFSDCLPIWNANRDVCLLFHGEVYSDGADQRTSRASYLVQAYEEAGDRFFEQLNGWFAGIVIDLRKSEVTLFNDRYGLGRIYFHENGERFYFSSEAKSLLHLLPETRELDLQGLAEFFACGCVLQNRTLFSGVQLLPPGSAWTFKPSQPVVKKTYFNQSVWEEQEPLSSEVYYNELKETWRRVLPRYFRGNEVVGLSLTGGVDSRMILGWAPRGAGQMPCYTFGGRYRDCSDVTVSREIASVCGQKHRVIGVGSDYLARFGDLAEKAIYVGDGAFDVTGSIDLFVQEVAREIAPVRVTGTNGGEILRRLVVFKPGTLNGDPLSAEMGRWVDEARKTYNSELEGHRLSFTAFKQSPWFMGSKFILERSQLNLRMPYFDNELVRLAYRTPKELVDDHEIPLRLAIDGNPVLRGIRTDRSQGSGPLAGSSRVRNLIQEFTCRAEYAYDYGMPQWFAPVERALGPLHLEKLFLGWHKFTHFRLYYRNELAHFVRDTLLDPAARRRPYLNGTNVENLIKRHLDGTGNYTREIHKLLSAELIQRKLIEQN